MQLVLTHYVDSDPAEVEHALDDAVSRGLAAPEGADIRVSGTDRLTAVEIAMPIDNGDGATTLTALRFASIVADELALAA